MPHTAWCGEASIAAPLEKPLLLAQAAHPPPPPPAVARADQVIFELARPMPDPKNFNWYYRASVRENGAHQVMWEPLFLLDYKTGNLEPWLAKDLKPTNTAQDEWTLTLRDGVEWSDSKPDSHGNPDHLFTAADVIFTVQMALDHRINLPAFEAITLRSWVVGVSLGTAPRTVVFKLRKPNPRFKLENFAAALFSSFLIMPKSIWQDIMDPAKVPDPAKFRPKAIGTGPYKLQQATSTKVTWERNTKWWGAKAGSGMTVPKPVEVIWQVENNEGASKADLIANNIDAAREYTLASFNQAKAANTKIIGWDPSSALAWSDPCGRQIDINVKYGRPGPDPNNPDLAHRNPGPWSDAKLRQALSLLLDRTKLAHVAYGDTTKPSRTMFPEYGAMQPFIAAVVAAHYDLPPAADPAKADTLLQGAGYQKGADGFYAKGGVVLDATILVNADVATDVAGATEVAAQLNAAGIKAQVQSISNEEYWGRAIPIGDYEMAYGWLSCGSVAEPYTSMTRYTTENAVPLGQRSPGFNNTGRWDTPAAQTYTSMVNGTTTVKGLRDLALDDGTIPAKVATAYKNLYDEMPFVPLVQSPKIIPFNTKYWTGWPSIGGKAVPMHSWAATHRLLQQLQKAPP